VDLMLRRAATERANPDASARERGATMLVGVDEPIDFAHRPECRASRTPRASDRRDDRTRCCAQITARRDAAMCDAACAFAQRTRCQVPCRLVACGCLGHSALAVPNRPAFYRITTSAAKPKRCRLDTFRHTIDVDELVDDSLSRSSRPPVAARVRVT